MSRYLSSFLSNLRNFPSDSNPERFQPNWFDINGQSTSRVERILLRHCDGIVPSLRSSNIIDIATANALQAESTGTLNQVPPDCGRSTSVKVTFRRLRHADSSYFVVSACEKYHDVSRFGMNRLPVSA